MSCCVGCVFPCRYSNAYDWRAFLAALVCSSGVAILWSAGALLLRKTARINGPGISVLMHIPGMKRFTATPNWTPGYQQPQLPVVDQQAMSGSSNKDLAAAPVGSTAAPITA